MSATAPCPRPPLTVEPPCANSPPPPARPLSIDWYRSPLPPGAVKTLHQRSDVLGALQTPRLPACPRGARRLRHPAPECGELGWAFAASGVWRRGRRVPHQRGPRVGHNMVFRSAWLNVWFCRLCLPRLGQPRFFEVSHVRHHRCTLHPPDDDENPLPIGVHGPRFHPRVPLQRPVPLLQRLEDGAPRLRALRGCRGEQTLYPADRPELARPGDPLRGVVLRRPRRGAHRLGGGWAGGSCPVVVCAGPFFGNGLFLLCNNTQHIACLAQHRLLAGCRTFTLNPFVQFIYWHMNYHTEHHMYAAVPVLPARRAAPADPPRSAADPARDRRGLARNRRHQAPRGRGTGWSTSRRCRPPRGLTARRAFSLRGRSPRSFATPATAFAGVQRGFELRRCDRGLDGGSLKRVVQPSLRTRPGGWPSADTFT